MAGHLSYYAITDNAAPCRIYLRRTEEPDVWESRLSGSERGRSATGVWGFATDGEVVYASISDALRFRSRSNRHRSRRRLDRDVALKILPEGVRWTTHRRLNATSES